jgi:hypothetical protein
VVRWAIVRQVVDFDIQLTKREEEKEDEDWR